MNIYRVDASLNSTHVEALTLRVCCVTQNFSGSTRLLRKSSLKSLPTTNRTMRPAVVCPSSLSLLFENLELICCSRAICLILQRNLKYSQNFNQEGCIPASHSTSCINLVLGIHPSSIYFVQFPVNSIWYKRKLCYYMFYANVSSLARDYDDAIFKGSGSEQK